MLVATVLSIRVMELLFNTTLSAAAGIAPDEFMYGDRGFRV